MTADERTRIRQLVSDAQTRLYRAAESHRKQTEALAHRRSCGDVRQIWPTARIVQAIRDYATMHGEPPSSKAWVKGDDQWPTLATVVRRYGSWNAAIEAAGYVPRAPSRRFDHDEAARRHSAGETFTALAREYGVSAPAVLAAVKRQVAA